MAAGKGFEPVTALSALAANVVSLQDKTVKPVTTKKMDYRPSNKREKNYMVVPWRAAADQRINKTAAYVVLTIICGYTNRHGETWVGQQTIADILGVSRQAVSKQIARLVELGYIQILTKAFKDRSARMRVVFDPKMSLEEVKANTPVALREDNIEHVPVSKDVARERIANLKNMIKTGAKTQPQKLRQEDGLDATSEVDTTESLAQPNGVLGATSEVAYPATSEVARREVRTKYKEGGIEAWLNEE